MPLPPLGRLGPPLTRDEMTRYARQVLVPEVGPDGQRRLRGGRVAVVGAGGLGSPVLLYLAAAGVGTLGIVDDDDVAVSNLHRQVVHGQGDVGRAKTASAREAVASLNPGVRVIEHPVRLEQGNAAEVLAGYDLVVDGSDNVPTRYLVSRTCVELGVPHVWAAVLGFQGQASVWWPPHGPCYRCVFPDEPAPGTIPGCDEAGVLGPVCGALGSQLAMAALALLAGVGEPPVGRLLLYDGLAARWDALPVRRREHCRGCGSGATAPHDRSDARPAAVAVDVPHIAARDLAALLSRPDPPLVVDVRDAAERWLAAIPEAVAIHLEEFRSGTAFGRDELADRTRDLVLFCRSGQRSAEAVRLARGAGHTRVRHLAGGILAWVREVDPSQAEY